MIRNFLTSFRGLFFFENFFGQTLLKITYLLGLVLLTIKFVFSFYTVGKGVGSLVGSDRNFDVYQLPIANMWVQNWNAVVLMLVLIFVMEILFWRIFIEGLMLLFRMSERFLQTYNKSK